MHIKWHVKVSLFFTARIKMTQDFFFFSPGWWCFLAFLAFVSVIMFFTSTFYTGFVLS